MRIIAYIDGFNLFYGALKGRIGVKWLDLESWLRRIIPSKCRLAGVKYFTAEVKSGLYPGDETRFVNQQTYLRALREYAPGVSVVRGYFLAKNVTGVALNANKKETVRTFEEKGTDVNLAAHLLTDAAKNRFDGAVIVSNDGDLAEALRLTRTEFGKKILLAAPRLNDNRRILPILAKHADRFINIRESALRQSQLPARIPGAKTYKPQSW